MGRKESNKKQTKKEQTMSRRYKQGLIHGNHVNTLLNSNILACVSDLLHKQISELNAHT